MRIGGLRTMGLILWPFILGCALALPNKGPPKLHSNCIRMTPEKEEQIDLIVEKLSNFLNNLTIEHEHFDIRLIKLSIEQHSEDEVEEKETVLQLSVNDCELPDDTEGIKEKAKQQELEGIEKAKQHETEKEAIKNEELSKEFKANATNDYDCNQINKNVEVMYLDLDETDKKLDKALGKRRPKLVYVEKDKGQIDYWYLSKART